METSVDEKQKPVAVLTAPDKKHINLDVISVVFQAFTRICVVFYPTT